MDLTPSPASPPDPARESPFSRVRVGVPGRGRGRAHDHHFGAFAAGSRRKRTEMTILDRVVA
ncbi:hypothetical protein GCM10010210_43630 [Pseudonocardia hydrocarbonoxydans]